jgi:hypothetical protein
VDQYPCLSSYVLVNWERVPLLLSLEHLTKGSTSDQITRTIIKAVKEMEGSVLKIFGRGCYVLVQTVLRCCRERRMESWFKFRVDMHHTAKECIV